MKRIYQYIMICVAGGMFAACGTDQEPVIQFPITEINQTEEIFIDNLDNSLELFASDEESYFSAYDETGSRKFYSFKAGASAPEEIPLIVENGAPNQEELLTYQMENLYNLAGGFFWQGGKGHCVTLDRHYTYSPDTKTWTVETLAGYFIDHGTEGLSNMVVIGDVAYQLSLTCLYKYSLTTREWSYTYLTHNFFGNGGAMPHHNYLFAVGDVLYAFDQDRYVLYAYDAGQNLWNEAYSLVNMDYMEITFITEQDGVFYFGQYGYYDDDYNYGINVWKYNANDGQESLSRVIFEVPFYSCDFTFVLGNNLYLFDYDRIRYFPVHD